MNPLQGPKQIDQVVWDETIKSKRELQIASLLENYFPGDPLIGSLKKWSEESIKEYGAERASPWEATKVQELKQKIQTLVQSKGSVAWNAWWLRVNNLIDESKVRHKVLSPYFCPYCGEEINAAALDRQRGVVYCDCAAIFIPPHKVKQTKEEYLILAEGSKKWFGVVDRFIGKEYLVLKEKAIQGSFQAKQNQCIFCKGEILMHPGGMIECGNGDIGVVGFNDRPNDGEKLFQDYFKCSRKELQLKEGSIFGFYSGTGWDKEMDTEGRPRERLNVHSMSGTLDLKDLGFLECRNWPVLFARRKAGFKEKGGELENASRRVDSTSPEINDPHPPEDAMQSKENCASRIEPVLQDLCESIEKIMGPAAGKISTFTVRTSPKNIKLRVTVEDPVKTDEIRTRILPDSEKENGNILIDAVKGSSIIYFEFLRSGSDQLKEVKKENENNI